MTDLGENDPKTPVFNDGHEKIVGWIAGLKSWNSSALRGQAATPDFLSQNESKSEYTPVLNLWVTTPKGSRPTFSQGSPQTIGKHSYLY